MQRSNTPNLITTAVLIAGLASGLATAAQAAVIVSSTAPTPDGDDIAQTLQQFNKSLALTTSLGQSFTTGSNTLGYELNAFTLRISRESLGHIGLTFAIRVVELDTVATSGNASYTTVTTQTGFTFTGNILNNDYLTFSLSPVALDPLTIYGVEVDVTSNGTGSSFAGQVHARGSNPLATGNFYIASSSVASGDVALNSEDLTFWTDITTVIPEPASMALLALGGLLIAKPRRR